MSMSRRSTVGLRSIFSGRSVNGTSVSSCAKAGRAHSGAPIILSPANARPPLSISRRVLGLGMWASLSQGLDNIVDSYHERRFHVYLNQTALLNAGHCEIRFVRDCA